LCHNDRPPFCTHLPQVIIALAELPLRVAAVVCGAHDEWRVDASCDPDGAVNLNDMRHILHSHTVADSVAALSGCAGMDTWQACLHISNSS
jgi:hypothetical protein